SLDDAQPATHDAFRGRGNFSRAMRGLVHLKEAGLRVQINFTVTKVNRDEIEPMYELAKELKAFALYLFLLVPVGCGIQIADAQMLGTEEVENWLKWVAKKNKPGTLPLRAICAPHYYRIEAQMEPAQEIEHTRKGCLAAIHMCFVSHKGDIYPCGYLPTPCGNVKATPFPEIWKKSPILESLRNSDLLKGRCGACGYKDVCGGCRARAFYTHQDLLQEEPFCAYEPAPSGKA
ncbi:MAG: SPASM domain-containing protein, partial [Elusimicrobiota bacterium]